MTPIPWDLLTPSFQHTISVYLGLAPPNIRQIGTTDCEVSKGARATQSLKEYLCSGVL